MQATPMPASIKIKLKSVLKVASEVAHIEDFWKSIEKTQKPTQLQRYEQKGAPECIKHFIALGGGPKMGTTLEQYARYTFKCLQKRKSGKEETGYDHLINIDGKELYVEQKSSGHWGEDDYKWQHVEEKHKWSMLLLCGIDYTDVLFWAMNRVTFSALIEEGRITNQGNAAKDSSEGMWFNYSDVRDHLIPIRSHEELLEFAASLPVADE